MKRQRLDELDILIESAVEDSIDEFDEFGSLDISDVEFSPSYKRRRHKIIRRYKYAPVIATAKKICSRVAMFAGVILTAALITVMSVSALREAIIGAVIEWYNDYVSVRFETEAPTENIEAEPSETEEPWEVVMKARRPREIPEGVEEVVRANSLARVFIDYYSYSNDAFWASYSQTLYNENNIYVDNEAVIIEKIDIHGYEAIIIQSSSKEEKALVWNDGIYVYRITTIGSIETLISLGESIE